MTVSPLAKRRRSTQQPARCHRGGLAEFIPAAKLFASELLRENLFGSSKPPGNLGLRRRQQLVAARAVRLVFNCNL